MKPTSIRKEINFLPVFFCFLLLACGEQKKAAEKPNFKPPKIVEAKSYKVPLEKAGSPKVVPAWGIKKIAAGKPEIVYLKSNVVPAKPTRVVLAGSPKLILPHGEGYRLPKVVPAIDSPFIAGAPEIILMKDLFIKENNPESFSSIKAMHGLNSNEISSLCEDKAGNIWIGAWWGGVSKYDGRFLTNYSVTQGLSSDVVNCVFEDNKGNIWIGTNSGVNKFDGTYITHYSTKEGLGGNQVWDILQDKGGHMWFATFNGITRYDGSSFTHFTSAQGLADRFVMSMFEDSKGNLWAGAHGGLTRFTGNSFQNYTTSIDVNDAILVRGILEDNDENIWFATAGKGLLKYDGQFITQFTREGGLRSDSLTNIKTDLSGDIWIGTFHQGAIKYDGKSFTRFSDEQGLGNEVVEDILQDKRGNIWVATIAGVSKFDGKLFSHIAHLKQEEVESLLADKRGNIWIGSGSRNSLSKYDGKSISRYTTAEGFASTFIFQIIEDRHGNIWFGSSAGVDKYDGRYLTNYSTKNGLLDNSVFSVMEDRKGNLWFGAYGGLSKFDGKIFTNYSIGDFRNEIIHSLLEDHDGNIWIGTSSKGVYSFDGSSFTHYDPAHSLSHPTVIGMIEDKNNNIWFCTGMGINKYDGKYFTWYTTEQGLSNNNVKNVLEDKNGNIWIGTISGMNLLRSKSELLKNTSMPLFKKYTISEGFLGGGTYENSITQDSSGNIWIGATDRVARYHREGDLPDTIPPTIQLRSIALFNETINWLDAEKKKDSVIILNNGSKMEHFKFSSLTPWYNQPKNLQLNYDNNYLSFQFIGITTYRPKEVRYQYFLEGIDKNWSNITDQPEATYNNLPHGQYIFKARAVNSEGYWSEELIYSFAIMPPWWKTWWAYLSYAVSFGVMIWSITWHRSRQLKAENILLEKKVERRTIELEQSLSEKYQLIKKVESQEALLKERLRISRELHDDIGSTLSSISIYSEVAKKRMERRQNTVEVLSKIGHASRELIDKMSDIVWSLNPNNESFDHLQSRMMAFAALILASRDIRFDFAADENLKVIQFTGEQRKNIFLIFKEALHNMIKYADCKRAWITLSVDDNILIMAIKDDGKGFDVAKIHTNGTFTEGKSLGGNGLANMHTRANDMNAALCIHSKINEGTTIQLTLQL